MKKPFRTLTIALALSCLLCTSAFALEVTDADVAGESPYKVLVKEPINPKLVGFFACDDDAKFPFAYALIERDGKYMMFVKVAEKYQGWVGAHLVGDVIYFGKGGKAKITLSDEGIHRTFKGKAKTALHKVR